MFAHARSLLYRPRVNSEQLAPGVHRVRLSNSLLDLLGFRVEFFLVDELLIDTGHRHQRREVLDLLAGRRLRAIALTHHHEDHTGNAGPLAARHDCPVYLARPELLATEGLDRLPLYRRFFWGRPAPYVPEPMPDELDTGSRSLLALRTPGHSATHTVLFDPDSGLALVGDLFLSERLTPTMPREQPSVLAASLRSLADLGPRRIANAHGKLIDHPEACLRRKADRLDTAAERVRSLHRSGASEAEIIARVFPSPSRHDRISAWMSLGDYSYGCFVRGCLRDSQNT